MGSNDELARDHGGAFGTPPPRAAPVSAWLKAMTDPGGSFREHLRACYGDDPSRLERRRALWIRVLERFVSAFGTSGEIFMLGVPSRVNWEGHHVDHQGGSYNATTDEREMVAAVRARADRKVRIANAVPDRFADASFVLGAARSGVPRRRWDSYVYGALLALAEHVPAESLRGMDLAVAGDVPIGAGLSSSHALVLASVLAGTAVAGVQLDKRRAVAVVQAGEWHVGCRTGLGDQATMIFGKRDHLFSSAVVDADEIVPRYVPLPAGLTRVLVNSFTRHRLAGEEGLGYNARVFACRAAYPLVLAGLCELGAGSAAVRATRRLADIHPARFSLGMIYRALAGLPSTMTLAALEKRYQAAAVRLAPVCDSPVDTGVADLERTYFGDGPRPKSISITGVALYVLAECWRSRRYPELLAAGDVAGAGKLVYVGHDGDRVMRRNAHGAYVPNEPSTTSAHLLALAFEAESGDPRRREAAALELQPGDYRASIAELDELVDICRDAGAVSASLTGGGLGGVVTAMVASERLPDLRARVLALYAGWEQRELEQLEQAAAAGATDQSTVGAARRLQRHKRVAYEGGEAFAPDPALLAALQTAAARGGDVVRDLVRLLPVDYETHGVVENGSVAGAGYLMPP